MKKILLTMLLIVPMSVSAEHLDVIEFGLLESCPFDKYMGIVNDFNEWGDEYGYHAKIAMPLQNDNLTSLYWMGTSQDAATYGRAWDTWRDALGDPDSTPARLWARFLECSENLGRWGYDVY